MPCTTSNRRTVAAALPTCICFALLTCPLFLATSTGDVRRTIWLSEERRSSTTSTTFSSGGLPSLPFYLYGRYGFLEHPLPTDRPTNYTALWETIRRIMSEAPRPVRMATTVDATSSRTGSRSSSGAAGVGANSTAASRDGAGGGTSTGSSVTTWVLPYGLQHPTRNHDSVVLEGTDARGREQLAVITVLGRWSRYVQRLDLLSGRRQSRRVGPDRHDPAGRPLGDLNHVAAVMVDALGAATSTSSAANGTAEIRSSGTRSSRKEIWLPCGFHGDALHSEVSAEYARIVDADTLAVRLGPRLPYSGGACVATALRIVPDEPEMICTFAGTLGWHDNGTFSPHTSCYDRRRGRWWDPFGDLPYGLDHGSLAAVPPGVCSPSDPARILIMNFRTRPYGDCHPEILAYDLPEQGWTIDELERLSSSGRGPGSDWYVYHNVTQTELPENEPRDASGVVVADNGRRVLNFGGTAHRVDPATGRKYRVRFSMIRSFDVCDKEWSVLGDLGLQTLALQSCASHTRNVAFTCGGEAPLRHSNSPFCFASRWDGVNMTHQEDPISFKKEIKGHEGSWGTISTN